MWPLALQSQGVSEEGLPLTSLKFQGNRHFTAGELRDQLFLLAPGPLASLQFWSDPPLYRESMMQRDQRGLLRFYQRAGFIHASVRPRLERTGANRLRLIWEISEGPRVAVASARVHLADSSAAAVTVWQKGKLKLRTRGKEGYSDEAVQQDLQALTLLYTNAGYAYAEARVTPRLSRGDSLVELRFQINPGPRCLFGPITIRGDSTLSQHTVTRQLAFRPGKPYSEKNLEKSQRQIYQTGVYQFVTVRAMLDSLRTPLLPVAIQLKAAPRWTIKAGVGYGIEEHERILLDVRKLAFLGGARRLNFNLKHSYLEPWSLDIALSQYGLPAPQTSLVLNPFFLRQREPGFTVDRAGANVAYQQHFATYTDGFLRYTLEQNYLKVSGLTREEALDSSRIALYQKSSITLGLARDSSLPLFYPDRGLFTAATITWAGVGFRSDFHYLKILGEARYYRRLGRDLIAAMRVKVGSLRRLGSDRFTPIEERFYAGGAASVRGWSHAEIGPTNSAGKPVGGSSLLETGIEFRYPLLGPLSGVLFCDAGNVWSRLHGHRLNDLATAAGTGLRYRTPIGPIRLDFGWPVGRGRNPVQIHLSVGQAF